MSDISTKLTYLNTTKSQLKDQINYGLPTEKQITSSTTFRNYVSSIFEAFLESLRNPDTLFTNLPKTTGTGTQITLNNTAYAPMRIELNPTAISQDGTPTPDNPQDIHTISGNNSVVVDNGNGVSQTAPIDLGKNLFDKNNAYVSGNNNQDIAIQLNDLKVGTKYKFYANEKVWLKILTYDSNNTLKRTLGNTNATKVIEFYPQSGETSFYFSFYAQNNVDISTYDFTNVYIFENDYELGTIGNYKNRIFKNIPTDEDYSSERDEGAWYLKKEIKKINLTDYKDVAWWVSGQCVKANWTILGINDIKPSSSNDVAGIMLSSHFKNTYVNDIWGGTTLVGCAVGTDGLYFANNGWTANEFKTYITNNNVIVYNALLNPTYTKITGTLETQLENIYKNMLSYSGQTNISQINNDLPFTLDVSAIEVQ